MQKRSGKRQKRKILLLPVLKCSGGTICIHQLILQLRRGPITWQMEEKYPIVILILLICGTDFKKNWGNFHCFTFGDRAPILRSTQWIADASILTDQWHDPTLSLIYLPHLDYCLQKFGPDLDKISKDLNEIDKVIEQLVNYYEKKDAEIIILSEYGIGAVNNPIHLNRLFRENDLFQIRVERGLELLDPGASKAFVVADHQIAHVYINDASVTGKVKSLWKKCRG